GMGQVPLDKTAIGDNWPLISYLIADPVYNEMYIDYLREVADQLDPDALAARYQAMATLLEPYAAADVGADTFAAAVQALTDATYQRAQLLEEFLASQ
ncbi:MAG: CotH kinase family protein, partial [Anaerolineales bacterium]|nr:CotH kinase family protein [Anaerolineales bacterium]